MDSGVLERFQGVAMWVFKCSECLICCYVVTRVFLSGFRCSGWLPRSCYVAAKVFFNVYAVARVLCVVASA